MIRKQVRRKKGRIFVPFFGLIGSRDIGEFQKHFGLLEDVDDLVDQFQFGLVEVVYRWAMGVSFKEIIEITDVKEGSIVRVIQQLVETLEDIRKAAQILGNPTLQK